MDNLTHGCVIGIDVSRDWLHLFALTDGQISARYRPGLKWEASSTPVARTA